MRTSAGPELKSNQELEQVLGRLKSRGPESNQELHKFLVDLWLARGMSNQELEQVLGRLMARTGNV
jgi:hypothetical protein